MNKEISARIVTLVASGMTVADAIDSVLGSGSFAKIASEVYEALRKRR